MVSLTDEAIRRLLTHESIEHTFACGARSGVLRWLAPDRLLSDRSANLVQEAKR